MSVTLIALLALFTSCQHEEPLPELPADAGNIAQEVQEDGTVELSIVAIERAETYRWYLDGEEVQNTDARTFIATVSGMYKVAGVNEAGEGKASPEVVVTVKEPEEPEEEFNILTEEYVPDPAFREWIKQNIASGSDAFTNLQAKAYDGGMMIGNTEIEDLTGIEYFTSIESFGISQSPGIASVDLRKCKELKSVNVLYATSLIDLKIEGLEKIESLQLGMSSLIGFDINALKSTLSGTLKSLNLAKLQYTELDLKEFTLLEDLDVSLNQLTTLDLNGLTSLRSLTCSNQNLTELNVAGCSSLESLVASYCSLKSLDLSANPNISILYLQDNTLLGNLDLSPLKATLTELSVGNTGRTSLDLSGFSELTSLECWGNNLEGQTLDLSGSPKLTWLRTENTGIVGLDLYGCTELTEMYCYDNNLERLDVSANRKLSYVCCNNNPMTEIKVWPEFDINNPPVNFIKDEKAQFVYEFGGGEIVYDYEVTAQHVEGYYYGSRVPGQNKNWLVYMSEAGLGEWGEFREGNYYELNMYSGAEEPDKSRLAPPEGTYTMGAGGAFSFNAMIIDANWNMTELSSGSLTISDTEEGYTYDLVLTDVNGETHHVVYTGAVSLADNDLGGQPYPGQGNIDYDVEADFTSATATAEYYGNFYYNNTSRWLVNVMPVGAGDGMFLEFIAPEGTMADGLAAGTYSPTDQRDEWCYRIGYVDGYQYGSWYSSYNEYGQQLKYTPLTFGDIIVEKNGDTYTIILDCTNDAYPSNTVKGTWTGKFESVSDKS